LIEYLARLEVSRGRPLRVDTSRIFEGVMIPFLPTPPYEPLSRPVCFELGQRSPQTSPVRLFFSSCFFFRAVPLRAFFFSKRPPSDGLVFPFWRHFRTFFSFSPLSRFGLAFLFCLQGPGFFNRRCFSFFFFPFFEFHKGLFFFFFPILGVPPLVADFRAVNCSSNYEATFFFLTLRFCASTFFFFFFFSNRFFSLPSGEEFAPRRQEVFPFPPRPFPKASFFFRFP